MPNANQFLGENSHFWLNRLNVTNNNNENQIQTTEEELEKVYQVVPLKRERILTFLRL